MSFQRLAQKVCGVNVQRVADSQKGREGRTVHRVLNERNALDAHSRFLSEPVFGKSERKSLSLQSIRNGLRVFCEFGFIHP